MFFRNIRRDNNSGNATCNVALRRVRATLVAVEEQ